MASSLIFEIPKKLSIYDLSCDAIGIDFGTTECCAAVIRKNGPEFVVLDPVTQLRTMPSFIAFDEKVPKCGQVVIDRMRHKAEHTVYDIKRILGRDYDEIVADPIWPFDILRKENGTYIAVETHKGKMKFESEKVAGYLLCNIKKTIEDFENHGLTDVVISVPSELTEKQKSATKKAAEYAGWKNIHFIPEPVAAAFAYFTEINIPNDSIILICDVGGGTVDICIAKIINDNLKILTYNGDSYLGGRDFDRALCDHFASILKNKHHVNLVKNNKYCILKRRCQDIKHNLSVAVESFLDVSDFNPDSDAVENITRDKFEAMTKHLIVRTKNVLVEAIRKAILQKNNIDFVLQVGGGCRMPMIKNLLSDTFPRANHHGNVSPDWVVAHGAALYAYYLKTVKSKAQEKKVIHVRTSVFAEEKLQGNRVDSKKSDNQKQNDKSSSPLFQSTSKGSSSSAYQSNARPFNSSVDDSPLSPVNHLTEKFGGQQKSSQTSNKTVSNRSSASTDEIAAIVIDNGSSTIKAGLGGYGDPHTVFSTIIGQPKVLTTNSNEKFIGNAAQQKRDILKLKYPIERGIVKDWDAMESIWHYLFYDELKVHPEDHPVLITELPMNPKINRERMTQIMFETFKTAAMYVSTPAPLSLYSTGRTSGFVLDCGEGVVSAVPICEGYSVPHAINRQHFGGGDITDYLMRILYDKGYYFTTTSERENVREMKEKLCFVALDFQMELARSCGPNEFEKTHTFSNNQKVTFDTERFRSTEVLFQPTLLGLEFDGVHIISNESISKCRIDDHKDLYSNIILTGGSSEFPGFAERFIKEIQSLTRFDTKVIARPDSKHSAWLGGSILTSLSNFQQMWVSKAEYDESGPSIIHRKCF